MKKPATKRDIAPTEMLMPMPAFAPADSPCCCTGGEELVGLFEGRVLVDVRYGDCIGPRSAELTATGPDELITPGTVGDVEAVEAVDLALRELIGLEANSSRLIGSVTASGCLSQVAQQLVAFFPQHHSVEFRGSPHGVISAMPMSSFWPYPGSIRTRRASSLDDATHLSVTDVYKTANVVFATAELSLVDVSVHGMGVEA